jgi:TetR/AcrR family fatty acid metabolism transcriptional regulator
MDTKTYSEHLPAPGSLKERQRQERVELILQTAEAVLAEKGYYEMSMDEIAARVGIAKGTIYLHFPSKEDLFVALFKRGLTSFLDGIRQVAGQPLPARDRLKLILTEAYGEQRKKQSQIFMSVFSGGNLRRETIEKQFSMRDYFKKLADYISKILEDGKAAGEFDGSIPTLVMLTAFLALLNRPHYEELLGENLLSAEDLANQVGRVYFHGISGK